MVGGDLGTEAILSGSWISPPRLKALRSIHTVNYAKHAKLFRVFWVPVGKQSLEYNLNIDSTF